MLIACLRTLVVLLFPLIVVGEAVRSGSVPSLAHAPTTTIAVPLLAWMAVTAVLFLLPSGGSMGTGIQGTTHGSAGWAGGRDLRDLVQSARRAPRPGVLLLAPYGRRRRLALPPELATHHALVVGPSGSGKTRGIFLPNTAHATGSFVATDPKGELWEHTSGCHARAWRFAPREPEASHGCNWIPLCRDHRLAELLAAAVMQVELEPRGDPFWPRAEQQLCAALFMHAASLDVPTPASLGLLLQEGPDELVQILAVSRVPQARQCAALLDDLRLETTAAITLGVANKLAFLRDPQVQRFTSAETTPPDFSSLLQTPTAVYWVVHEGDIAELQGMASLFFTLLLDQLTRTRPTVPVTFFLDEFANLGRLPHFPTTISVARGRGLALVLGVQALSQLEARYGKHGADAIRTNCATKVILHGLDGESAEQVSRMLGEATLRVEYRSRRPEGFLVSSPSYQEHELGRRLLTPDEVRRIGTDELLVVTGNRRPIRARKWWWDQRLRPAPTTALGDAQASLHAAPERCPPNGHAPPSRAGWRLLDGAEPDPG